MFHFTRNDFLSSCRAVFQNIGANESRRNVNYYLLLKRQRAEATNMS